MGGQHQLDLERADLLVEVVGLHPGRQQSREGVRAGAQLRGFRVPLVLAAPANAVMLLGDVGEGEEVGERSRDGQRLAQLKVMQRLVQRCKVLGVAKARPFGERPHALDHIE